MLELAGAVVGAAEVTVVAGNVVVSPTAGSEVVVTVDTGGNEVGPLISGGSVSALRSAVDEHAPNAMANPATARTIRR